MNSRRNEEGRAERNVSLIWEAECACGMTLLAPWVNVIDGKLPCLMCGAMADARAAQEAPRANENGSVPTAAAESTEQPTNSPEVKLYEVSVAADVPTWLHCSHYLHGAGQFTKRAVYFSNPTTGEYTIPCVVCPECLFAALTPHTVCAGVGPDPMPDTPTCN